MKFGIYVHIPYCLQRCPYCDFATYEWKQILPPQEYVQLVQEEIRQRADSVSHREVSTVYFGGGTPSLIEANLIVSILDELEKHGFLFTKNTEITLEINPATIDHDKLKIYKDAGINRFSVGAQTFDDQLLNVAGRKHSKQDTIDTLNFLKSQEVNYSFDLLFALPQQTLKKLELDIQTTLSFSPKHISTYCLTVPENHPMQVGRAPENEQLEMFDVIDEQLENAGLKSYEISNYAAPGFESRHNLLYWTDQAYWGIGLSSHSYLPSFGTNNPDWGIRFWNPRGIDDYTRQIQSKDTLPSEQMETLEAHQSLTDFCHTSLRMTAGLDKNLLEKKFPQEWTARVYSEIEKLQERDLIVSTDSGWAIPANKRSLSNLVFEGLVFLPNY